MDSLSSLLNKKQYDLVIKITENTKDGEELFCRLAALVSLGRVDEALQLINKHHLILEKTNLYSIINWHIDLLCALGMFDEAFDAASYYRELPYESQKVEELLQQLTKRIRKEEKEFEKHFHLSFEDVSKFLNSSIDDEVLFAVKEIEKLDVYPFMDKLLDLIINHPKQTIRSSVLLLLVFKKINRVLEFNSLGTIIKINPSEIEPPFVGEKWNDFIKNVNSYSKDTTLIDNVVKLSSLLIILKFPIKEELDDLFIESMFEISKGYLGQSNDNANALIKEKIREIEDVLKMI